MHFLPDSHMVTLVYTINFIVIGQPSDQIKLKSIIISLLKSTDKNSIVYQLNKTLYNKASANVLILLSFSTKATERQLIFNITIFHKRLMKMAFNSKD